MIVERLRDDGELTLVDAERDEFGISHAEVGAAALGVMKFPTEFVNAVGTHHMQPQTVDSVLGRVIVAADSLACVIDPVTEGNCEPTIALAALGLPADAETSLIDEVKQDEENLSGFLSVGA
jgi:hypothetical protein